MKISQDCAFAVIWIVAPWNCYQESVVCLASRDLYQASCSRSQSVNASKTLNKRQEDNWSRLSQLLGNANLWEGFTWTMKHFAGFRILTFCLNTCSVGLGLCQMQQSSMDVSLNMCLFILAPWWVVYIFRELWQYWWKELMKGMRSVHHRVLQEKCWRWLEKTGSMWTPSCSVLWRGNIA